MVPFSRNTVLLNGTILFKNNKASDRGGAVSVWNSHVLLDGTDIEY